MTSRFFLAGKDYPPIRPEEPRISVRTALLLLLAQYAATLDIALLYAAHQAVSLIAISAAVAFCGAYRFFDEVIE
jgi:hypothetical protein